MRGEGEPSAGAGAPPQPTKARGRLHRVAPAKSDLRRADTSGAVLPGHGTQSTLANGKPAEKVITILQGQSNAVFLQDGKAYPERSRPRRHLHRRQRHGAQGYLRLQAGREDAALDPRREPDGERRSGELRLQLLARLPRPGAARHRQLAFGDAARATRERREIL